MRPGPSRHQARQSAGAVRGPWSVVRGQRQKLRAPAGAATDHGPRTTDHGVHPQDHRLRPGPLVRRRSRPSRVAVDAARHGARHAGVHLARAGTQLQHVRHPRGPVQPRLHLLLPAGRSGAVPQRHAHRQAAGTPARPARTGRQGPCRTPGDGAGLGGRRAGAGLGRADYRQADGEGPCRPLPDAGRIGPDAGSDPAAAGARHAAAAPASRPGDACGVRHDAAPRGAAGAGRADGAGGPSAGGDVAPRPGSDAQAASAVAGAVASGRGWSSPLWR